MKRTTIFNVFFRWLAPLLVLVAAGLFIMAMGSRAKPGRKKAPPRTSIPVEVITAKPHTGPLDIVSSGVAIPYREVRVAAQVGGEVVFKAEALSPGQYVEKNQTLLKVDSQNTKLEIARLQQEYAKAEQELDNIQVKQANTQRLLVLNEEMVELRRKDVERLNRLQAVSASSASEADSMRMAWLSTSEQLTTLQNQLRELKTQTQTLKMTRELVSLQLKRAELDLSRATVVAPFSGVVISTHVEQNGTVMPGAAVATIEDTSMVEVRCSLRSDDLEFILQNSPAASALDATSDIAAESTTRLTKTESDNAASKTADAYRLPATPVTIEYERGGRIYQWDGRLSRQDGLGIDTKTRTMPVRIRVANPSGKRDEASLADSNGIALLRGMFVQVKLHCQPQASLMSIPESVVRPGKHLWVMRDNKLRIEPIRIARIENGRAFFDLTQCHITASDTIISSPVPNARDGIAVSLLETRGPNKGPKSIGGSGKAESGKENAANTKSNGPAVTPSSKRDPKKGQGL